MARLIVVTSRLPYPPREGHQLRSWHLLKALAAQHEVTLLSFLRDDDDLAAAGPMREVLAAFETFSIPAEHSRPALLQALARGLMTRQPFVAAKYASPDLRQRLRTLAVDADLVHFDMLPLMAHADCVPAHVPVVFNAHNVEHLLLSTRANMEARPHIRTFLRSQVRRLHDFERDACKRADLVISCSDDDTAALRELAPTTQVQTIANGVDLEQNRPESPPSAGNARLVFVGQMGWFPNRDGVEWFLRDIFPKILAKRPDAEFILVGKTGGLQVPDAVALRVRLAGFVPDLRPLVHDAAVYVVPLRAGSGTRLKVLEAMALGKAIVTTHIGSEGILLEDGQSALYADDAEAFATTTLALLDAPERIASLGAAARTCAEAHYGWDAIGRKLLDLYGGLLGRASAVASAARA